MIDNMSEFDYISEVFVVDSSPSQNLTSNLTESDKKKAYHFLSWEEFLKIPLSFFKDIFFSTPYLELYHAINLENFKTLNKIYLGYSILWSSDERLHFELDFFKEMDFLVYTSSNQLKGYLANQIPENRLIPGTDPMVFALSQLDGARIPTRYFMLWTPHWTTEWYGFTPGYSTFFTFSTSIYVFAKNNPKLKFLIRPHSFLEHTIQNQVQKGLIKNSPQAIAIEAWNNLLNLKNVNLSKSQTMQEDLVSSFLIVSDYSSTAMYTKLFTSNLLILKNSPPPPVSVLSEKLFKKTLKVTSPIILRFFLIIEKYAFLIRNKFNRHRVLKIKNYPEIINKYFSSHKP